MTCPWWTLVLLFVINSGLPTMAIKRRRMACTNDSGERGICTFVHYCILFRGRRLGSCMKGIFSGTCCLLTPSYDQTTSGFPPLSDNSDIETRNTDLDKTAVFNKPADVYQNYKEVCGLPFPSKRARIIGGEAANYGKWPWMISLRHWKREKTSFVHKCGAVLLSVWWAITAAHCVDNVPPSEVLLRVGDYDLKSETEPDPFEDRRLDKVIFHKKFDRWTYENDLALLRLRDPLLFRRNILPVCIPQSYDNYVGKVATVTGWGRLYDTTFKVFPDDPYPSVMQEVQVPIISNQECESMYQETKFVNSIPDVFVCAGTVGGSKDSCEGDSGGPMVLKDEVGRWILIGIISWGIGCAIPNYPGVYTRVSKFADWIESIIGT